MTHEEMVDLIRSGVGTSGGVWADFGAGTGNFTRALRDLIGEEATIYAIDRDEIALQHLHRNLAPTTPHLHLVPGDFTKALPIPELDGLLIANSLHWAREHSEVMALLTGYLKPGGRFLLIEYDADQPRSYIPFPVTFDQFKSLAENSGLTDVREISRRGSQRTGIGMYAASADRSTEPA